MKTYPLVADIFPPSPEALLEVLPREGLLFLDSSQNQPIRGRYSFMAFSPFQVLHSRNGKIFINGDHVEGSLFTILQSELNRYRLGQLNHLPSFQGGIAGMLGYELAAYIEKLPPTKQDDLTFPDCLLGFYDCVIAWDHELAKAWIFSTGFPFEEENLRQAHAKARLECALDYVAKATVKKTTLPWSVGKDTIQSTFSRKSYEKAVEKVIEYIRAGDIFEANISQRFSTQLPEDIDPLQLYCKLRTFNPAPFSAYFQCGEYVIASASPERFLQLKDNIVETRPIKGTRSRDKNPKIDSENAVELASSEKDRAENIMIVDLMRNDLSRVCKPHSVKVTQLCEVESFQTVHHLVSAVKGELMDDKTPVDLLKATFPGGSITGAPKIRAMEIINEIEPTVRGPYCGSMGYLAFNQSLDLSIIIRTFALHGRLLTFQVGGAVTVDSCPHEEYNETLAKASALLRTLTQRE